MWPLGLRCLLGLGSLPCNPLRDVVPTTLTNPVSCDECPCLFLAALVPDYRPVFAIIPKYVRLGLLFAAAVAFAGENRRVLGRLASLSPQEILLKQNILASRPAFWLSFVPYHDFCVRVLLCYLICWLNEFAQLYLAW